VAQTTQDQKPSLKTWEISERSQSVLNVLNVIICLQTPQPDLSPRLVVSLDHLLDAILSHTSGEALVDAARLALSWHADVAAEREGRLAQLPDARKLGLLALESSVLARVYRSAQARNGGAPQAVAPPGSGLR
jgi:hypothetical protein